MFGWNLSILLALAGYSDKDNEPRASSQHSAFASHEHYDRETLPGLYRDQ